MVVVVKDEVHRICAAMHPEADCRSEMPRGAGFRFCHIIDAAYENMQIRRNISDKTCRGYVITDPD